MASVTRTGDEVVYLSALRSGTRVALTAEAFGSQAILLVWSSEMGAAELPLDVAGLKRLKELAGRFSRGYAKTPEWGKPVKLSTATVTFNHAGFITNRSLRISIPEIGETYAIVNKEDLKVIQTHADAAIQLMLTGN